MDFQLTPEQVQVVEATAKVCQGRFGLDRLRALEGEALPADLWQDMVEAGFTTLTQPVEHGGSGVGRAEAVLVFEELGRSLLPGPLVWTHLWSGLDTSATGAESGHLSMTGGVMRGAGPVVIEHLASLDRLAIVDDEGVWGVAGPEVLAEARLLEPVDPLTPVWAVDRLAQGEQVGGADQARRFRSEGALLTAAFQVGLADASSRLATEYARSRIQFSRPIGSFQAIKHILADMLVRVELARMATYAAAAVFDEENVGDRLRAASVAKVMAADAAGRNGTDCVQVHGGMGFTWEVPAHLYLKRAWVLEQSFGTSASHCRALAENLPAR